MAKDHAMQVSPQDAEKDGRVLDNGLVRVPKALIIPAGGTVQYKPVRPINIDVEDRGNGFLEDTGRAVPPAPVDGDDRGMPLSAPDETVPAKRRGRRKAPPAPEPERPRDVSVRLEVPGFGSVPSRYRHAVFGKGVVLLGLTQDSYVPSEYAGGDAGIVMFPGRGDGRYVYVGNSFRWPDGTEGRLLVELPESNEQGDDDDDYDEEEQ